jgi:methionine sulfoxide reductase heme-binding subunit
MRYCVVAVARWEAAMSVSYRMVQWNRHKVIYDIAVIVAIVSVMAVYFALSKISGSNVSDEVLLIRASAVAGFCMLHVTLMIGPLTRLMPVGAILLYNRRHLGVLTFVVCAFHATLATLYYGAFGGVFPLTAMLSVGDIRTLSGFPFEWLGFAALLLLAALASTSHDFWLKTLTPRTWKWLHMSVYVAYVLVVGHVMTGALQSESARPWAILLLVGCTAVAALHAGAAWKQHRLERSHVREGTEWIRVARIDEFCKGRAKIVSAQRDTEIAVFAHEGKFHGISNVCAHQGGPLGEGAIIDGCVTCPWHGYQYVPESGCSPPPFTERVASYEVRVEGATVWVRSESEHDRGVTHS